ncbi:GTP cyclohydrolase I [Myxococcus landrumensis]|uniref:GTP cyclohydrolase I n=2 Tax=Myxococcus landrumensis TaxID=2813577 RepID=A0ABX7NBX9_9BACT|nr:GTP cyclohydrolase I [Myxococcus landrumus]
MTSSKARTRRAPVPPPPVSVPDPVAMAAAVKAFLHAAGLPLQDANLVDTPQRVADAWCRDFLDGYAKTPEEALGKTFPTPRGSSRELVVVTNLRFHSMCPHHLLPVTGVAHVAYVPGKQMAGFGRLSALVDCFAHRLILQEELAREVASSLARVLGSPGTACVIEAEQACLRMRGAQQRDAITHAEAYEGELRQDGGLRRELWARLGARR